MHDAIVCGSKLSRVSRKVDERGLPRAASFIAVALLGISIAGCRKSRSDSANEHPQATTEPALDTMIHVPGGTFEIAAGYQGDRPMMQTVNVAPFEMDVTEVTTAAYAACVAKGVCTPAGTAQSFRGEVHAGTTCNAGRADRANHPVNCVDWNQATAYCRAEGKRLPTRAEWEYAARGGAERRTFPWGAEAPAAQVCWSGVTKRETTCAVGSFPRGAFGFADLAGNVWEWTGAPGSAEMGAPSGGSWHVSVGPVFRGVAPPRYGIGADFRLDDVGFRCAR